MLSREQKLVESHNDLRTVAHELGVCYCWDYGCEPGEIDSLLKRVRELKALAAELIEGCVEPSIAERRRARKAAKNREMYKRFGRRPWDRTKISIIAGRLMEYTPPPGDVLLYMDAKRRMAHLREPSGFKEMSRKADMIQMLQHAQTIKSPPDRLQYVLEVVQVFSDDRRDCDGNND